jgi:hypothetical protein
MLSFGSRDRAGIGGILDDVRNAQGVFIILEEAVGPGVYKGLDD